MAAVAFAGTFAAGRAEPSAPEVRDFVIEDVCRPATGGLHYQRGWDRFADFSGSASFAEDGDVKSQGSWTDTSAGTADIASLEATATAGLPAADNALWNSFNAASTSVKTTATYRSTPLGNTTAGDVQVGDWVISAFNTTLGRALTNSELATLMTGVCPPGTPPGTVNPMDGIKIKFKFKFKFKENVSIPLVLTGETEVEVEGTIDQYRDLFKRFGSHICDLLQEFLPSKAWNKIKKFLPCT